jgi:DNA-binding IscR family transcriptional regulator
VKLNQDFGMAVETVVFLGERKTADYIQAAEIARVLKFSVGYLQKVIQTLSKHGVVECKRGRVGGVRIRAKFITLLDLWNITCGELDFADPQLAVMKKPLKAFADAMSKVVVHKRK